MISILFIVPKMSGPNGDFKVNSDWGSTILQAVEHNKWKVITPSLLVLAAIAENMGFEAHVVDEEFENTAWEASYDIVSFYTVTPNVKRAYEIARFFKEKGSYIVMGGVHASLMQEEVSGYCDTLMVGEGEYIFAQFLNDFNKNTPKKKYVQECGKVQLKDSPIPAFHFLSKEEQKLIPIQTARGCSHYCNFCNVRGLYGSGFRSKDKTQIKKELEMIKQLPYAKSIYVTDDNIMSTQEHFDEICEAFYQEGFTWYANTDIKFAENQNNIQKAYDSGLRQVLIGFESVEASQLLKMDKDNFKYTYFKHYKEYIERIQSYGIGITGSFIVGDLEDTENTFRYLEEFIYDVCLYGANITFMTPYPGTQLFVNMKRDNRIQTFDWNHYTIFQPVVLAKHLTIQQVNNLYVNLMEKINGDTFKIHKLEHFKNIYKKRKNGR